MKDIEFKIRHKEKGWTGTLIIELSEASFNFYGSHKTGGSIRFVIEQDFEDEDGNYVEDPNVASVDELEILAG